MVFLAPASDFVIEHEFTGRKKSVNKHHKKKMQHGGFSKALAHVRHTAFRFLGGSI